ncbi:MAG: hypothetical protein Q8L55_08280 [Phycisphaerales bacterium]|nr:hypothetical protein [Phycisphaerales bacterium]
MHDTCGKSRHVRPALWRRVAAWSVIGALAVVAAAPIWHDHARDHGPVGATALAHPPGTCGSHDHAHGGPSTSHSDQTPASPSDEHDPCAICVAAHAPNGDGLPSLPLFDVPVTAELLRRLGAERRSVEWVGRDRASRGPPAIAARPAA